MCKPDEIYVKSYTFNSFEDETISPKGTQSYMFKTFNSFEDETVNVGAYPMEGVTSLSIPLRMKQNKFERNWSVRDFKVFQFL